MNHGRRMAVVATTAQTVLTAGTSAALNNDGALDHRPASGRFSEHSQLTTARGEFKLVTVLAGALRVEFSAGPVKVPVVDALASLLLVASSLTLLHNQPIAPGQQLALVIAGLVIVLRRSWPLAGTVVLLLAMVGVVVSGPGVIDCGEILPAAALVIYADGAALTRRASLVALAVGVALVSIEMLQDPVMGPGGILVFVPLIAVVWGAGRGVAVLRGRAAELERRAAELSRQQAENSRLAVEVERARVGVDLQAVIADGLRSMLDATAAARAGEQSVEQVLGFVQERGRLLLDDMRSVLGVLRRHSAEPDRAPQPSLRDLDRLVSDALARGIPVTVRQEGDPQPLAAAPDRSAYRIIERVLESEPGHAVEVWLRWHEREVEVAIDAPADPSWPSLLAAVRERVTVCGGYLATTRTISGRDRLCARLPVAGVRA